MKSLWLYRLSLIWAGFFTITSLGTCIMLVLQNTIWATLSGQGKFLIVVGVLVNWGGHMMAFISNTNKRIAAGQSPINGSDPAPVQIQPPAK